MRRQDGVLGIKGISLLALGWTAIVSAQDVLTLQDYLQSVRARHDGVVGTQKAADGAREEAKEALLTYSPSLFANAEIMSDAKPTLATVFMGTRTDSEAYSLGVSQNFDWGMQAKIEYDVNYTSLVGISPAFAPMAAFFDARPFLSVTQSLWRNGLGSEVRATADAQQAQSLAESYTDTFQVKQLLLQAELNYWRLALTRETARVEHESLDRAGKIRDFEEHQARLELADRADYLQAEAAYEARALQVQEAEDDQRSASRDFNSLLGVQSEEVAGELAPLTAEMLSQLELPKRGDSREDVLAAEEQEKAAASNYQLALDRNTPTLNVSGSLALNGRAPNLPPSITDSYDVIKPTAAVSLEFLAPLDFGLINADKQGALKQREGAELVYRRKKFDLEIEWVNLNAKLSDLRRQLDLALKIEQAEETKLTYEKERHRKGRSTTYQVLQFEQDYAQAQLNRIGIQAQMLQTVAQMKTFVVGGKS